MTTRQQRRYIEGADRQNIKPSTRVTYPIEVVHNPNAPKSVSYGHSVGKRCFMNAKSRSLKPTTEGNRVYEGGTVLDKINESLEHSILHPTKGYRVLSERQIASAVVCSQIKQGHIHPIDTKSIRREMKNAGG